MTSNPTNVVWIQTAFLGDLVLTTGAFQLLRLHRPAVRQFLITTPIGAKALEGTIAERDLIVFDKKKESLVGAALRLRRLLKQNGCTRGNTLTIQAHRSWRSTILATMLGLPIATYHESQGSVLATYRVDRIAYFHETTRIALLLQPLGISREQLVGARPRLEVSKRAVFPQELAPHQHKTLIGVAPGSVWGTKRWPLDSYTALVKRLLQRHQDAHLVLLGSKDEIAYSQSIIAAFDGEPRLTNLVGKTELADLPLLYQSLRLLISNDSSPIHYASAMNVPTLAIFGATTSSMGFGPLAEGSRVIEQGALPCRPCSDHGPSRCPLGHFKCMKDISVEIVADAALAMLEEQQ
jgi:heptosyltransferase-2